MCACVRKCVCVCEHACVCEGVNALGIKAEILYQATCQPRAGSSDFLFQPRPKEEEGGRGERGREGREGEREGGREEIEGEWRGEWKGERETGREGDGGEREEEEAWIRWRGMSHDQKLVRQF